MAGTLLPKPHGRRAFAGASGGFGLDAYDYQILSLVLVAVIAHFGISKGQAGLLATVTLVVSAVGGIGSGLLIDRIGRSRMLMITVRSYALSTVLCGFAWNYPALLTFRALQGLGCGGEWAAGASLVAEYASAKYRGRTVAVIQSSWAVGWALAVIVTTNVLFGVLSAVTLFTHIHVTAHENHVLLILGFPLGFCFSAIFSGFGSYLAELFPRVVRGAGQGFCYNTGRAMGAFFPDRRRLRGR